ncbi:ATP-binding protein [Catenulispora yoronensis]
MTQQHRSPGPIPHRGLDRRDHEHRDSERRGQARRDSDRRRPHQSAGRPGVSSLSWSFPGTAADVSCSRRWLAAAAVELWGEGEDTDRLVLAYSEIATNAVVHGAARCRSRRASAPPAPTARSPTASRLPQARGAGPEDLGGRGLEMVRATVDHLRVASDAAGKTVSFEVGRRDQS